MTDPLYELMKDKMNYLDIIQYFKGNMPSLLVKGEDPYNWTITKPTINRLRECEEYEALNYFENVYLKRIKDYIGESDGGI